MMKKKYLIVKTVNNNCMIVEEDGREKMVTGKGIAFGKKAGECWEMSPLVEKVFVIEEQRNVADFQQLLRRNDQEFISFCEGLIWELSQQVNTRLNERIHVSLIDHLSCTLHRLEVGEQIVNPFLQEIEVLYQNEMVLAEDICRKISEEYHASIPRGEVGFVAIHIHSAMYNGKIQDALKENRTCNKVLSMMEEEFQTKIDRKAFDCGRFMTHLTYMMKRIKSHEPIENELAQIIAEKYPQSFQVAKKAALIIKEELRADAIPLEEVSFLTMHIERLRQYAERMKR